MLGTVLNDLDMDYRDGCIYLFINEFKSHIGDPK